MQKKIIAITTITTFATLALANAQATSTNPQIEHEDRSGMHKMMSKKMDHKMSRVNVIGLILAGNYTDFQAKASTTAFAKIDSTTFSNLSTQMNAEKTARESVMSILKNAGLKLPMFGMGMER